MSSVTSRAQPSTVLKVSPGRMRIHSIENVFDYGDFVSLGLVGLDIRAAQRSEVVQHQMDVTSNGRGRPGEFGYSRHTPPMATRVPIKTFRQWPILQPETLDF